MWVVDLWAWCFSRFGIKLMHPIWLGYPQTKFSEVLQTRFEPDILNSSYVCSSEVTLNTTLTDMHLGSFLPWFKHHGRPIIPQLLSYPSILSCPDYS